MHVTVTLVGERTPGANNTSAAPSKTWEFYTDAPGHRQLMDNLGSVEALCRLESTGDDRRSQIMAHQSVEHRALNTTLCSIVETCVEVAAARS